MEISTFKVKVQKAVSEVLGQEYTVELREVQKNNGVLLQGLMIRKGQDNVTPTIILFSFFLRRLRNATIRINTAFLVVSFYDVNT